MFAFSERHYFFLRCRSRGDDLRPRLLEGSDLLPRLLKGSENCILSPRVGRNRNPQDTPHTFPQLALVKQQDALSDISLTGQGS